MKKALYLMLIVSTGMMFCKSTSDTLLQNNTTSYQSEGWIDDETFQVRALGAPNPDAEGKVKRRTQSKDAALLAAQARVIELLLGARVQAASGSLDGESTGVAISKEFEGFIKGGSIVELIYDTEDNCEIVYRIHAKSLKKKAKAEVSRLDEQ